MEAAESVLRAGYHLERYELLCPIASGGMATVWLARLRGKRGFEKLFAIKTIRAELVDDPQFQEMFLDEARIASGIQHPNVTQILDLGEQEGVLFIVMEWVDGDSLAKLRRLLARRGATLPAGVVLRILVDASAGLHAAHELRDESGEALGVVHRDVSPQNILVSTSGAAKVIDFGIAKAHNRRQGVTRTGVVKGKIQYMAPEQLKKGRSVDRRTDVWALGICLHELLTGKTPYDEDDDVEVIQKLVADVPPPIAAGLPDSIVRALEKCLAIDPEARFPTAAALQRALEGAMRELGETATHEDVAAFVTGELPELAHKRKDLIGKAIGEARERGTPVSDPRGEVAFAPTLVGGPGPSSRSATRATVATPATPRPTASRDEEPIEIPKRSRAWLWGLLLLVAAGGGAAVRYPVQASQVLAKLMGGAAAQTPPQDRATPALPSFEPHRAPSIEPPRPVESAVATPQPSPSASASGRHGLDAGPMHAPLHAPPGSLAKASSAPSEAPSVEAPPPVASTPAPPPPSAAPDEDPNNPYGN